MRWHRAAIATCATTAVLAGAVTAVTAAVAADEASARPASSTGGSRPEPQAGSAYRSSVTIVLDGPAEACMSLPAVDRGGQRTAASCGATVLPVGATEQDVLEKLGEPQRRRPLSEDSEAWEYSRYLDGQHYAFADITLAFRAGQLVNSEEYIFK